MFQLSSKPSAQVSGTTIYEVIDNINPPTQSLQALISTPTITSSLMSPSVDALGLDDNDNPKSFAGSS